MDFSLTRILVLVGLSVLFRLATVYLGGLDSKEADDPEAEGRAIAASRRRAQAHLWLLGVLLSSLTLLIVLGTVGSSIDAIDFLSLVGLALADALCFHRMLAAYGDARRIRSTASG